MPLCDGMFRDINAVLRRAIQFQVGRNLKTAMDEAGTEIVLRAVSGGLVDEEENILFWLACN